MRFDCTKDLSIVLMRKKNFLLYSNFTEFLSSQSNNILIFEHAVRLSNDKRPILCKFWTGVP